MSGFQNVDLVSPTLDLTAHGAVTLSLNHDFREFPASSGTLSYSIDNGINWVVLQTFTVSTTNPSIFSQTIPAVAGHAQIKFKWNFTGTWAWYWAVDDVQITGVLINRQLSNIMIPGGTANCYNAAQTITVAGSGTTFEVKNGGSATIFQKSQSDFIL